MKNLANIEQEIKALIIEILEIEPEKLTPEAKFVDDLGMDSMMALEIVAAIEKKYKIIIPEENLPKLTSFKDVMTITRQLLGRK